MSGPNGVSGTDTANTGSEEIPEELVEVFEQGLLFQMMSNQQVSNSIASQARSDYQRLVNGG